RRYVCFYRLPAIPFGGAILNLCGSGCTWRIGRKQCAGFGLFEQTSRTSVWKRFGNLSNISLDILLEERSRELYWEAFRRTDLIRYGRYTGGSYLWPFKGGQAGGASTQSYRTLFPIPAADLIANPNLEQNTGY